jgi:hypothetical protein
MTRHACKICVLTRGITLSDTFATEDELLAHIRREHTRPELKAYPCSVCGSTRGVDRVESFDTREALAAHIAKDHPGWTLVDRGEAPDRCFVLPDGSCVSPLECPHGPPDPDAVAALLNLPAATVPFIGTRSDGKIPVPELTRLLRTYGLRQLILVAWDGEKEHVATDGATLDDADNAAEGGNFVKKALGWPTAARATSARLSEFVRRVAELCSLVEEIDQTPSDRRDPLRRAAESVREALRAEWTS